MQSAQLHLFVSCQETRALSSFLNWQEQRVTYACTSLWDGFWGSGERMTSKSLSELFAIRCSFGRWVKFALTSHSPQSNSTPFLLTFLPSPHIYFTFLFSLLEAYLGAYHQLRYIKGSKNMISDWWTGKHESFSDANYDTNLTENGPSAFCPWSISVHLRTGNKCRNTLISGTTAIIKLLTQTPYWNATPAIQVKWQ